MNSIAKIVLGAISFLTLIFLYVNELNWLNNTFDRNSLIVSAVITGMIVGLGVAYKVHSDKYETLENFQIFIGLTLVCGILMPLFFSISNRLLTFRPIENEKVTFIKSNAFQMSRYGRIPQERPDGYHCYVIRKGELKRIYSAEPIYMNASEGQLVDIPVKKGLFGFSVAYPNRINVN